MHRVGKFVLYDDIEFSKSGWIHRNRYLRNGEAHMFTLPLRKDSDFLDIRDRKLSDSWSQEKLRLRRKLEAAYRHAPYFSEGIDIFDECASFEGANLFQFVANSIKVVAQRLELDTELLIASEVGNTKDLRGQDRVISLCQKLGTKQYLNPIGGAGLYDSASFREAGIELAFNSGITKSYDQMRKQFIPNLSVLDSLMFDGITNVTQIIKTTRRD
jgi:hypothetical protein